MTIDALSIQCVALPGVVVVLAGGGVRSREGVEMTV